MDDIIMLTNDLEKYALMERMMHYRMRTSVIHAVTQIPARRIKAMYSDLYGKGRAPVGAAPADIKFFINCPKRQLETMELMHLFEMNGLQMYDTESGLDRNTVQGASKLIDAYEMFLTVTGQDAKNASISLARAWHLHSLLEKGVLTKKECDRCGSHFVVHFEYLTEDTCAYCQSLEEQNEEVLLTAEEEPKRSKAAGD
jgi:hypothetical protein